MRNLKKKIFYGLICNMVLLLIANSAFAQEFTTTNKTTESCLKVRLITNSTVLRKESPISITVSVDNSCGEDIKFYYKPSFVLDKIGSGTKKVYGDTRQGIVISDSKPYFETYKTRYYIKKNTTLKFVTNTNETRWMDSLESNEVFSKILEGLDNGEYNLRAKILLGVTKDKKIKRVYSNTIKLSYDGDIK